MKITILGKEVELKEDQYLVAEDTGKIVLRNHFLSDIVRDMGIPDPKVSIVPEGTDPKASIYLVRATITIDGRELEEYGEVNQKNLKSDIAREYPFSVARSRAIHRLTLKILGLDGKVLGEDEIDSSAVKKPEKTAPSPDKTSTQKGRKKASPEEIKEKAGEVVMHFGATKGTKVKDFTDSTKKYVLGLNPTNKETERLVKATKIYFQ